MEKFAFMGKETVVPSTTLLISLCFPNSGLLARRPKNKDMRKI